MQCTRKPNNNGQQVRKKRIKKQVNQNRKKKQTNQSARARNKEPFLWETYFRGSDKRKFARSFWND